MRALTGRLLLGLSRAARAAAEALHDGAAPSEQGRLVAAANAGYDMAADPDEAYYADRYLARLKPALARLKAGPGARLGALEDSLAVEAAGQGRYILAVAWRKP